MYVWSLWFLPSVYMHPPPHQVEALRTMYTRKVRDLEARLKVGGTHFRGGGMRGTREGRCGPTMSASVDRSLTRPEDE